MSFKDFQKGDVVKYVPAHVRGDEHHEHCQKGLVSSVNEDFVNVRYGQGCNSNSQATRRCDLVMLLSMDELKNFAECL